MSNPPSPATGAVPSLEAIVRLCAEAAPGPWYPSAHARAAGITRDSLDPNLEILRLGGVIRLTDWVKDLGQGYVLTEAGTGLLRDPGGLARLREGRLPAPREEEEPAPVMERITSYDRGELVREALLFPGNPPATRVLLLINLVVFTAGFFLALSKGIAPTEYLSGTNSQDYRDLLDQTGAVQGQLLLRGQWWRLLTSCFVHIGVLHILLNMMSLHMIGRHAERGWGSGRFLVIYLLAGLGGSTLAMLWNPLTLLAGASGALCGILAAQAVWVYANRDHMPVPLASAWMRNLMNNGLLIFLISLHPRISFTGHLGGAVVGAAAAGLLHWQRFGEPWQRRLAVIGLLLIPVLCVAALLLAMDRDIRWWQLRLQGINW